MAESSPLYTIRCIAELLPNQQLATVRQRLAECFQLDAARLNDFFNGSYYFERQEIDAFTLQHYQQLFNQIGLVTVVTLLGATENFEEQVVDENSCPRCSTPKTNSEQCTQCGIYFAKYKDQQYQQEPEIEPARNEGDEHDKNQAVRFLKIAAMLFTIAFIVDDYMANLSFLEHAGIDIGYLPYLLATGFLTAGSFYLMRLRGYQGVVGLIAVIGPIGLGILLLLPDRRTNEPRALFDKNILLGIALIFAGYVWSMGKIDDNQETSALLTQANQLHLGRNEYPKQQLDDIDTVIDHEFQELIGLLDSGLVMIAEGSLRPDAVEALSEKIFYESSRFLVWLQYQQYLQVTTQSELTLTKEIIKDFAIKLKKQVQGHVTGSESERLKQVFSNWFFLAAQEEKAYHSGVLSGQLIDLFLKLNWSKRSQRRHGEEEVTVEQLIAELPENELPAIRLEASGDQIILHFLADSPFKNEPSLVLAYYYVPYMRYNKQQYSATLVQINPQFPNKYLSSHFGVYHGVMSH